MSREWTHNCPAASDPDAYCARCERAIADIEDAGWVSPEKAEARAELHATLAMESDLVERRRRAEVEVEREKWETRYRKVIGERNRETARAEKAEAERDGWERSAGIWEQEAVDLLADRTRAEADLAALRKGVAGLADVWEAEERSGRGGCSHGRELRRALLGGGDDE